MKHEAIEEKFLDYVEGVLSQDEQRQMQSHMGSCPSCQLSLSQYKRLMRLEIALAKEVTDSVPSSLSVKIMDGIETQAHGKFGIGLFSGRKLGAYAATLAVACAAIVLVRGREGDYESFVTDAYNDTLEQPKSEIVVLQREADNKEMAEESSSADKRQAQWLNAAPAQVPAAASAPSPAKLENEKQAAFGKLSESEFKPVGSVGAVREPSGRAGGGDGGATGVESGRADAPAKAKSDHWVDDSVSGSPQTTQNEAAIQSALESTLDKLEISSHAIELSKLKDSDAALGGKRFSSTPRRAEKKSELRDREISVASAAPTVADELSRFSNRANMPLPPPVAFSTGETYGHYEENQRTLVSVEPVSTFSVDVDTGSYTNMRRFLQMGQFPPADAVRIEEMVNYFDYNYPSAADGKPFAMGYEIAPSPLDKGRHILKVALKARDGKKNSEQGWNLVFLVDVSGSMADSNKLELIKRSLHVLVDNMRTADRVAVVTYADGARVALESTSGSEKGKILGVIDSLSASGGTNGGAGIDMAYDIAGRNKISGGTNRVILATDGDFNVGTYDFPSLVRLVEEKRRSGVSMTTIGVGQGDLNEQNLEQLADKGNGNYFYFDTLQEARNVLETRLTSTIETIAKDVKVQVEFNPAQVKEYRLLGFDNRKLDKQDFNNDAVDAGEIGANHAVTALYEIVLTNSPIANQLSTELRYQKTDAPKIALNTEFSGELGFVKIRYKEPNSDSSQLLTFPMATSAVIGDFSQASNDLRFATAVAYAGQVLRQSTVRANFTLKDVLEMARGARGEDKEGKRQEFIKLIENVASANPVVNRGNLLED